MSYNILKEAPTLSHQERLALQSELINHSAKSSGECNPQFPFKSIAHYYDDDKKFAVCLPTKTGSRNWLKVLSAQVKFDGKVNPMDLEHGQGVPKMPKLRSDMKKFSKQRQNFDG